jgi:hypothetical protein
VSSLRLPLPSSSEASLLWTREAAREPGFEFGRELARDDCLDLALLDVVLPLSRALRLRSSCMVDVVQLDYDGSIYYDCLQC